MNYFFQKRSVFFLVLFPCFFSAGFLIHADAESIHPNDCDRSKMPNSEICKLADDIELGASEFPVSLEKEESQKLLNELHKRGIALNEILFEEDDYSLVASGGTVPYWKRYTVYDKNQGDYDYVYVFRVKTTYCPYYISIYGYTTYSACSAYTNVTSWGQPRAAYYSNGYYYIEYLYGKGKVDWYICWGWLAMKYS